MDSYLMLLQLRRTAELINDNQPHRPAHSPRVVINTEHSVLILQDYVSCPGETLRLNSQQLFAAPDVRFHLAQMSTLANLPR